MLLRKKSVLVLTPILMLMVVIQVIISWKLIYPSFETLENEELQLNVSRINQAINQELNFLDATCNDWAAWDYTFEFVENQNAQYMQSNLTTNFFTDLEINFIQYVDLAGNIVWRRGYDFKNGRDMEFTSIEKTRMDPDSPLIPEIFNDQLDTSVKTFLNENDKLLLVAARPIITSDHQGPPRGTLIMAKFLNQENITENTHISFRTVPASVFKLDQLTLKKNHGSIIESSNRKFRVVSPVYDAYGKPIFLLDIDFKRNITLQGKKTISTSAQITVIAGLIGIMVIIYFLDRYILLRLSNFDRLTQAIQKDMDFDIALDNQRDDEIGHIYNSFNKLLSTIRIQTLELKSLSLSDPLTRLGNRRLFDKTLKSEWPRHRREGTPLCILICDIDYFKNYNDHYGHQQGDECITSIASTLKESAQRETDIVARYGGEEFVIIMPTTDAQGAKLVAERIQENVAALNIPHAASKIADHVTLSIGIACMIPDNDINHETLVKQADQALYESKGNGRNTITIHQQTSQS